jgi:predicted small lipoprotein YifL
MDRSFWATLLILGVLLFSTAACEDKAPLKLTAAQRDQVDTLFTAQVKSLNAELDSLCQQRYEMELDAVVDSILRVRRAQEQALRKKYQ